MFCECMWQYWFVLDCLDLTVRVIVVCDCDSAAECHRCFAFGSRIDKFSARHVDEMAAHDGQGILAAVVCCVWRCAVTLHVQLTRRLCFHRMYFGCRAPITPASQRNVSWR